jgi:PAS domain S-box-containing protein
MTNNASNSRSSARADDNHLRRLWPQHRPSRRLITVSIAAGLLLLMLFAAGYWQVSQQFVRLEAQRRGLERSRDIVTLLDSIVDLQRTAYADTVAALNAARNEQRTVDRNALDRALDMDSKSLAESFAKLSDLILVKDRTAVDDCRRSALASLTRMHEMVSAFVDSDGASQLDDWRRRVMVDIMDTGMVARKLQALEMTAMRSSDALSSRQLEQAQRVAFAVLLAAALIVMVLGWMLVRYVNKREEVEQFLRNSTGLWRGTITALKQGVAVYSQQQQLVLWNPRLCELYGISEAMLHSGISVEEMLKHAIRVKGLSLELEKERTRKAFESVMDNGVTRELEIERVDGSRLQLGLYPMPGNYCILTLTDVTSIRRAEQLARDQAVRLGTIMNSVPDGIVTINSSGSIESWNAGAERLFGYEASEVIRRNVSILMNEPYASNHDLYLQRYLYNGDAGNLSRLRELTARRQDGSEFPIDLRISEMRLGEKRMFVGVIRDITERRAIEKMKNEFISTVSHELRTPLTSIMGSLTLLMDGAAGPLTGKAERLVGMAEKNSQRLTRLINDILDLEKAEAGRLNVRLDPQPLLPLLHHSLEMNRSYGSKFEVELTLHSEIDDVTVMADEVRFLQVMANLLSNAIKYSPPHSAVLVEVTQTVGRVRVTVHDAGPGISAEFKSRVFQRFAQADGSDSKAISGTGLGLAITKQLVELHGGAIGFDTGISRVGSGSGASFWVELSVVSEPSEVADVGGPLDMNILLCEDDPDVAEVLVEMLRREGCQVTHVGHAAQVSQMLDPSITVLLMDIDLPDQNGLSLVAELRRESQWRDLPVVVVSGTRMTPDERQTHAPLNVTAWLDKPVGRGLLRAALAKIKSNEGKELS